MELKDAIDEILNNSKPRNFTESVELAINLKDLDLKDPKNRIDTEIMLPKGRGKPIKIAVFASGELAVKSKKCADRVIDPSEIAELGEEKRTAKKLANEFDALLAEAPLMPVIGKRLGVALGPRGKMPKPLPPLADPEPVVKGLRNTVRARSKQNRTFHIPIGVRSMSPEDIENNARTALKRIGEALPRDKANIASVYIKTSMGQAVRVEL